MDLSYRILLQWYHTKSWAPHYTFSVTNLLKTVVFSTYFQWRWVESAGSFHDLLLGFVEDHILHQIHLHYAVSDFLY